MKLDKITIAPDASLEDAIIKLDAAGQGIIAVVDGHMKLLGVITDGDIRRAFLNKETDIKRIMKSQPVTALKGITPQKAINFLKTIHRRHLPIVDDAGVLLEIFFLDDWESIAKSNKVIIMAGGLGSRLGELSKDIPKPMLPVGGKPLLENLVLTFAKQGFFEFLISINHKGEQISGHFGDGKEYGVSVSYIREQQKLGTAGSLSLIDEDIKDPFIVINADVITSVSMDDLLAFHRDTQADATMCVVRKRYHVDFGVVEFDNEKKITAIKEKPAYDYYINAGIYAFNPSVLKLLTRNAPIDMPALFDRVRDAGLKPVVYFIDDYWIDIGSKDDYLKASREL